MSARDCEARGRQVEALRRAFGPQVLALFTDDAVVEIMLNPDGMLWIERLGAGMQRIGAMPSIQAMAVIQTAAALACLLYTSPSPRDS